MLQRCTGDQQSPMLQIYFSIYYKIWTTLQLYRVGTKQKGYLAGTTFLTDGRIAFTGHKPFFVFVEFKL